MVLVTGCHASVASKVRQEIKTIVTMLERNMLALENTHAAGLRSNMWLIQDLSDF